MQRGVPEGLHAAAAAIPAAAGAGAVCTSFAAVAVAGLAVAGLAAAADAAATGPPSSASSVFSCALRGGGRRAPRGTTG